MTGPDARATQPQPKENPEALVLRGKPRPAVRFRRGLIVLLTGGLAALLVSLSWLALEPPRLRKAADSSAKDESTRPVSADALASLPANYGQVPRLGPPLPGDLGRPILEREQGPGAAPDPSLEMEERERAEAAADAERQRAAAARSSALMVQLGDRAGGGPAAAAARPVDPLPAQALGESDAIGSVEETDKAGAPADGQHAGGETTPPLHWLLSAGTVIPASLITGLNSDVPGMVLAQVTENVRDSATGRAILIPQGARLIGSYSSSIGYGQRRAMVVWHRIIFPDASSIRLDDMPATDASGFSGLSDRVDSHTWQLAEGIALSTLLGVGTQLSLGSDRSALVRAIRESAQADAANAGDQITTRNLDVHPTIMIRPGWPVRAIVNKDLLLQAWRP